MNPEIYDYSTIDKNRLARLPKYVIPPTYRLQERPGGNGCAFDPPGYPSYFTRAVYTQYGNSPPRSAQYLLLGRVVQDAREDWEKMGARLARLYKPLPIDHPRTRAWIQELYKHLQHCYRDPANPKETLICPVPYYKLRTFGDDPRFSDDWREKEKASIEQANREIQEAAVKLAIPENHAAVVTIRKYYPDYEPELDLIANPPKHPGDWWERMSERPTPENCPGKYGKKHPMGGTWCQMCGWEEGA